MTSLGVCATASPSHPPCNTPLPGGFLADSCLLHPPTYTPSIIDSNASLAPGVGGGPLPPSGGGPAWTPVPIRAAPCPSVRGRHRYPVRRPPRRPPGRGVDRAPTSGGGPRVFPRPDAGPGTPITGRPRAPPSRGGPACPPVRWRHTVPPYRGLTTGFVPRPPPREPPSRFPRGPPCQSPRWAPRPVVCRAPTAGSPVPRLSEGGWRCRTGLLGSSSKTLPTRSEFCGPFVSISLRIPGAATHGVWASNVTWGGQSPQGE